MLLFITFLCLKLVPVAKGTTEVTTTSELGLFHL